MLDLLLQQTSQPSEISRAVADILPYVLAGSVTYAVARLQNRNSAEKAKIEAQNVITQRFAVVSDQLPDRPAHIGSFSRTVIA